MMYVGTGIGISLGVMALNMGVQIINNGISISKTLYKTGRTLFYGKDLSDTEQIEELSRKINELSEHVERLDFLYKNS